MALRKPMELEELVDASSGKEIVVTPLLVDRFEDLKKKYEEFLAVGYNQNKWVIEYAQEVVLPCDINLFLQQTREYEDHVNYRDNTGLFITQLIQDSYKAGNNDFELDVNSLKSIDYLASEVVSGTKKRTVRVVIKGEVGDRCGRNAQYSTLTIGKAGNWCGVWAQHCTFTFKEAGKECGFGAVHSTFKTHSQKQYERFKKSVDQCNKNRLYLLAADGSILKGGKW